MFGSLLITSGDKVIKLMGREEVAAGGGRGGGLKRENRGGVRRTRAEEEEVNRPIYHRSVHYTTKGYTIKQHNAAVSHQRLCGSASKGAANHSGTGPR